MKDTNSRNYMVTAKDGNVQKFNAYIKNDTGLYATRFFTDNYPPGPKQWNGKGCSSFKKAEDAIAFGYKIGAAVRKAGDWPSIKYAVELAHEYKKEFA